jgi:hypothetical protein
MIATKIIYFYFLMCVGARAMSVFNRVFQVYSSVFEQIEKPLTGLFVGLGLVVSVPYLPAQAADVQVATSPLLSQASPTGDLLNRQALPDGVYLYGQAPTPEQVGAAYMVFAVTDRQVVGAFYMPYSSFDCFQGEFQPDRLALNIVDSYDRSVHPYSVALDTSSPVASATSGTAVPAGLEGFHQIQSISENDQRILATCQADFQN